MKLKNFVFRGELQLNLTPLIDIVFLLIIFFLVAANLNEQESQMSMQLPTCATGENTHSPMTNPHRLIVNIPDEHVLFLGNVPISVLELSELLRRHTDKYGTVEVHLRASRRVPYRVIEPVLVCCIQSGVWNVSFAVLPAI